MDFVLSESDELLINAALDQSAEACILLLHSRPHLRQGLILRLLRSSHNLHHDSILRIFSLSVFGYEPIQAVEYLMQLKPAGYCGHVFKEGEISYKCLDCAADPTCVVCAECFHGANHSGHRYIMQKTKAGGCCDCGDLEAWKMEGFCSKHRGVALNSLTDVPQPDLDRWGPAFRALIDFIVDIFVGTSGGAPGLASDRIDSIQNMYCVVMLNDDIHSFDNVESLLRNHCNMSRGQAHDAAMKIDEEGECFVFEGPLEEVRAKIEILHDSCKKNDKLNRRGHIAPLGLVLSSRSRRPFEIRALHLLRWLYSACCNSDIVRALVCGALLSTPEQIQRRNINFELLFGDVPSHHAFMSKIGSTPLNMLACIGSHSPTFKYLEACKLLQDIFIQLCNESSFKYACAAVLIENLVREEFPFEKTACKHVMFPLTVQILTVPSIVSVIATDLLSALLWHASKQLEPHYKPESLELQRPLDKAIKSVSKIFSQIGFMFCSPDALAAFLVPCKRRGQQPLAILCNILRMLQGMDPQRRKVDTHVEMDAWNQYAFSLTSMLHSYVIFYISHGLASLAPDQIASICSCLSEELSKCCINRLNLTGSCQTLALPMLISAAPQANAELFSCIGASSFPVCISVNPCIVSLHWPLHRMFAIAFGVRIQSISSMQQLHEGFLPSIPWSVMLHAPLSCLSTQAHMRAKMWIRNGITMVRQIHAVCNEMNEFMCEPDLFLVQLSAAATSPALVARAAWHFFIPDRWDWTEDCGDAVDAQRHALLLQDFLCFAVDVATAPLPEVTVNKEQRLKRLRKLVIHALAGSKNLPHSLLLQHCSIKSAEPENVVESDMNDILKSVAVFTHAQGLKQGSFSLRQHLLAEVDPLWVLARNASNCSDVFAAALSSLSDTIPYDPLPCIVCPDIGLHPSLATPGIQFLCSPTVIAAAARVVAVAIHSPSLPPSPRCRVVPDLLLLSSLRIFALIASSTCSAAEEARATFAGLHIFTCDSHSSTVLQLLYNLSKFGSSEEEFGVSGTESKPHLLEEGTGLVPTSPRSSSVGSSPRPTGADNSSGNDGSSIWNTQNRLFQRLSHSIVMRLCSGNPSNPCRIAMDRMKSSTCANTSSADDMSAAASRNARAEAAKRRALTMILRLQEQFAAISLGQVGQIVPTLPRTLPQQGEAQMESDEEGSVQVLQEIADDCCIVCREQGTSLQPLGRICHIQQSSVLAYSCLTPQEREVSLDAVSETNIHNPAAVYFQALNNPQFVAISKSSSAAASVLAVACTGWSIPPPSDGKTPLPAPVGTFVSGCGHLMHFKCFRTRTLRSPTGDTTCPLCVAPISGILPLPSNRSAASKRRSSSGIGGSGAAADEQSNSKRKDSSEVTAGIRRFSDQWSSAISSIFSAAVGGGSAESGSSVGASTPEWDMVEEFNRGIERSMAPDGQHCLFPNVMPWSHILHAAAYTIIATEVGCRVHDIDWDSNTGECLIVAGAAGGLCKTLSSSRQLSHLKCLTSACRSRCDIPVVEQYSQSLLHQLQALADTETLGIDLEIIGIVDSILACDTCSVLVHTLLLLPLDVPATVSILVRQTTTLLYRATLIQAVIAMLRDSSSESSTSASLVLSAAARVCAAADTVPSRNGNNSDEIVYWARFLSSFSLSVFGDGDFSMEIKMWTTRAALPLDGRSDAEVLEWSMGNTYARLLQYLRVALTCRVLLLGDSGMMLDNAGLGNGITMTLYGQELLHLLQLPQLHASPPLTDAETHWLTKCRSLGIPARAPARMILPSLYSLPEKFELLLLETSSRLCRTSGKAPNEPAVCLLCGRWLCASHNRCCYDGNHRIGAVSVHARLCSRSAGPFLMAKSSMLLCVGNNQGSLLPAPYLDTWGEEVRLLVLAV